MTILSFCFLNLKNHVNTHLIVYRDATRIDDDNILGAQWLPKTVATSTIAFVLTLIQTQLTSTGAQKLAV